MEFEYPAYMAGALTTMPPKQLSKRGTTPSVYNQGNATIIGKLLSQYERFNQGN